jgi:hypothetical protein
MEPTKHQYDYDSETVIGFLRHFGLDKDFKLNIEVNHATLAGHTFQHELQVAADTGMLGSIDANRGDYQNGWDTDQFALNLQELAESMLVILAAGGLQGGGVNFDAKILVDNLNKSFKATERLFDLFYSNRVMYFQYKGIRIPALFVFPDQATNDKAYKFSYTDNNKITITFSIEIETYFPSFDNTTEMFRGNVIDQILIKTIDKDSGQLSGKEWIDKPE